MKKIEIRKKLNIKTLMMAVGITACIINSAIAATPKTNSVITNNKITLGDVFDGVTQNASHYLAPAPTPGKVVILNSHDLTRISNAFHLKWKPTTHLEQVIIRRISNIIKSDEIQRAVEEKFAQTFKGERFDIELSNPGISFSLSSSLNKKINVEDLKYDTASRQFKATVFPESAPNKKRIVKGQIFKITQLPVLNKSLRSGDIISDSDIEFIDIREDNLATNMVVRKDRLIGLTPRRGIAAMKPINSNDVRLPTVVKKGSLVIMTLKSGSISLTAQGRAIDEGPTGKTIRVLNTTSNTTVSAVITGPQSVLVLPPSNALNINTL